MKDRTTSAWPSRFEWKLIIGFWTLIAVFVIVTRLLDPRGGGLEASVILPRVGRVFTEFYLWALLTPVIFWIAARFKPDRSRLIRTIPLLVGAGLVVALAVDLTTDLLRVYVFPGASPYPNEFHPLRAIQRFWFLDDMAVYGTVLATGFARIYYLRERKREAEAAQLAQEAQELEAQKAELEAQLSAARLEALRMQLNPHFLFNTLHAISTLVGRDPKGVRRMIARLSTLLRYVLDEHNNQEVPVRDELKFLRGYLEIQEIRFQGRLNVDIDVEPEIEPALVPTLILQPIVENAIKHGTSDHPTIGHVTVRAHRDDEWLVLEVADNGPGFDASASVAMEQGTGLANTKARLEGLYGSAHRLRFDTSDLGGLKVMLVLPYHEEGDLYAPTADPLDEIPSSASPTSEPKSPTPEPKSP